MKLMHQFYSYLRVSPFLLPQELIQALPRIKFINLKDHDVIQGTGDV